MNIGTYQRTAPRVNVLRGYFGNEPTGRSYSAPVTAGVTILSGQLISLVSGAWVLGVASGAEPFIAFADSTDTDVISSGLLLGLSCAGQYEIETAWFDNTKTYSESSFLSPGTGTTYGSVANSTPGQNNVGAITIATSNTDVIGYAVAGGRQDATAINSQSGYLSIADSASTAPGVPISGGGPPPTTGSLSRIYLLRFRTQWLPHVEVAS